MTSKPSRLSLPPEILLKIVSYLGRDAKSVARLGSTCKRLAAVAFGESVWIRLRRDEGTWGPFVCQLFNLLLYDRRGFRELYVSRFAEDADRENLQDLLEEIDQLV
jgi:hypothetical protein